MSREDWKETAVALGVGRVPVKLGGVAQENGQLRRCTPRLFPPRLDTDCIRIFCTSISSSLLLVVLRVPPRAIKFSTPLFSRFDIVSGRSQFLSFASWSKYAAPIAPSFLRPVFFSDGRNGGGVKKLGEMNIIIRDVKRDIGISLSELGFEAGQIHLSGRAARIIRQQTNRQFS